MICDIFQSSEILKCILGDLNISILHAGWAMCACN